MFADRQNEDSRKRAGLLWHLLDRNTRRQAAHFLSLEELRYLKNSFEEYRKDSREKRRQIEKRTIRDSASGVPSWPGFVSLGLGAVMVALFILHGSWYDHIDLRTRVLIFSPLLLGVVAPFSCYFLPAYRLRVLFRPVWSAETLAFCFFSLLCIVWLLAFIGFEQTGPRLPGPAGLSLFVLALGAVTAPLLEEVFFREFVPSLFPVYLGHAIGAVCFTIAHVPEGAYMAFLYLLAALFLSALRLQSGGLVFPYVIHACGNLTVLLLDP